MVAGNGHISLFHREKEFSSIFLQFCFRENMEVSFIFMGNRDMTFRLTFRCINTFSKEALTYVTLVSHFFFIYRRFRAYCSSCTTLKNKGMLLQLIRLCCASYFYSIQIRFKHYFIFSCVFICKCLLCNTIRVMIYLWKI